MRMPEQAADNPDLAKILSVILSAGDHDSLGLAQAPDDGARLCRAWLLQGQEDHPDHPEAVRLLSRKGDEPIINFLKHAGSEITSIGSVGEHAWDCFCPTASQAYSAPEEMAAEIRRRRKLTSLQPALQPLTNPATELLFTTNALISPPLTVGSPHIPEKFRAEAERFATLPQKFWYDHPVPLDAAPSENEILYGLARLDEALAEECRLGTLPDSARMDLAMSISVTHEGMEDLACDYVRDLIARHLNLRHLRVFLFDETRCQRMIGALCPGNEAAKAVFGVNGAYGRHYSFLKAVLLIWQMAVNPQVRFTFKIDLDQVFDQTTLHTHTGRSALQLLCNPHWGGEAIDYLGRHVDLGMLAGGLVNEADSHLGLFVPDVVPPDTAALFATFGSRRLFCPQWPQAVSTEAEILQRDGGYQRIHVTGGTTGICDTALRHWQPFTPSFINRAEDQAYAVSAFSTESYLGHLHAPGLIMRHDKQAFAARAIAHAESGKAIGDVERLMLFSRYAELHDAGFDSLQNQLWPFTASFLYRNAPVLAGLIFALDGAAKGGNYVSDGAVRLKRCLDFCQAGMKDRLATEQSGWQAIYAALDKGRHPPAGLTAILSDAMLESP